MHRGQPTPYKVYVHHAPAVAAALLNLAAGFVALYLAAYAPPADGRGRLAVTARRQFTNWKPLFDLYRDTYNVSDGRALRAQALAAAWCDFPLQPNTVYAPVCACVAQQHAAYVNATAAVSAAVPLADRQRQATDLVERCLRVRGTWRVFPVWSIHPAIAAAYVHLLTACLLLAATPLLGLEGFAWGCVAVAAAVLLYLDPVANAFWLLALAAAAGIVWWVLRPGLRDPPFASQAGASCLLWAEFFVAPLFAMFPPLYHSGRDIVLLLAAIGLGGVMASMALRAHWYAIAFASHPRLMRALRWTAWAAAVVAAAALSLIVASCYRQDSRYALGRAAPYLFAVTVLVCLAACPVLQGRNAVAFRAVASQGRNAALIYLLVVDFYM